MIVSHCVRTGDATNRISGAEAWSLTGGGLPLLPGPTFGASDATFFLSSPLSFLLFLSLLSIFLRSDEPFRLLSVVMADARRLFLVFVMCDTSYTSYLTKVGPSREF